MRPQSFFKAAPKGHHKRLLWKIVECLSAQASNAEAASVAKTAQNPTWVKWRKKMKNVLPNSFEFLIHQFNSLNRELIHELWINSSIQPVSESYAQRFYHWGHAGVREIFRQQTLGCPLKKYKFCWTTSYSSLTQQMRCRRKFSYFSWRGKT